MIGEQYAHIGIVAGGVGHGVWVDGGVGAVPNARGCEGGRGEESKSEDAGGELHGSGCKDYIVVGWSSVRRPALYGSERGRAGLEKRMTDRKE